MSSACEWQLRQRRMPLQKHGTLPGGASGFVRALREGTWDPSKHPRGGYPENRGWWSPAGGADEDGFNATVDHSDSLAFVQPGGPRRIDTTKPYRPSEAAGTWAGGVGNSKFTLNNPVKWKGELIKEIPFDQNHPVLDSFEFLKKGDKRVSLLLTGNNTLDQKNARAAWKRLNPNTKIPEGFTFHHDLRSVVEETVSIGGKKVRVLVGHMQLVPDVINRAVAHQGSASIASRLLKDQFVDKVALKKLASDEARHGGKTITRAAKRIVRGKIPKSIKSLIGRTVKATVPVVGTMLTLVTFEQDAEAHGVGGAIARATPVLGDLISVHDFAKELAQEIETEANEKAEKNLGDINKVVAAAWQKANEQTLEAFLELAVEIQVTATVEQTDWNGTSVGPVRYHVDTKAVSDALRIYCAEMQSANRQKAEEVPGFDFDKAAREAKQSLRMRLMKAAQQPPVDAPRRVI